MNVELLFDAIVSWIEICRSVYIFLSITAQKPGRTIADLQNLQNFSLLLIRFRGIYICLNL